MEVRGEYWQKGSGFGGVGSGELLGGSSFRVYEAFLMSKISPKVVGHVGCFDLMIFGEGDESGNPIDLRVVVAKPGES